jgi:hypothetical protein
MTKHIFNPDYHDCYEYHGNTTIELTRRQGEITLWRDWINFDNRFQVSGVRKILETDSGKQITADKKQTIFCLSHLFADTRHLKP